MNSPDNPQLRDILDPASELPPHERASFLDTACANNPELRGEIEHLLAHLDAADGFLAEPTFDRDAASPSTIDAGHPRHGEAPGARIGRYKLLQLIGEGGFGSVFMAEQETPVIRKVALKIIKLGMDTKQVIARFEAERQALAMMDHPNIAKVFDAGSTDSGRPYFVMELVKGDPITAFCDANTLTTAQRLELFVQVCSAVQHAHQKGIIHRDLKPSNVLVTMHDDKPVPKIIDFGVAKALNQRLTEHTLFTEFRQLIGTPVYMSPEQAQMSGMDVDTRSDIYSLGVLLYELLVGTPPFDPKQLRNAAYEEIRRIIREVEPPKPSTRLSTLAAEARSAVADQRRCEPRSLARTLEGELDWIVLKCLEKDRARRYDSATSLARDIERYLKDELVEASPPSLSYRLRKFLRRHKAVIGVGLLLLCASVFSTWQAIRAATHAAAVARAQQSRADQQAAVATTQTAKAEQEQLEARKQQRIAASVNQFLSNMLTSADPDKLLGDKVTVVQAIESAEKQLDAQPMDPLTEANLRNTIGRTLMALSRYPQAERELRKAVQILRKATSSEGLELAAAIGDLGVLLAQENKLQEAETLQRETLELYRKSLPAGHPFVAGALVNLGEVFGREGRIQDAEKACREALSIQRKAQQPGSLELRSSVASLGLLLNDANQLEESERLLREAVEIDRSNLPAGHPRIAEDLNNLGCVLAHRNKLSEAEAIYREALTINRATHPGGDPALSRNLGDLAKLIGADKPDEAEKLFREALDMDRRILPPDHPDIARDLNCLAMFLEHHDRPDEAERLYRQAVEIDRKSLTPDHPDVKIHLDNFTWFLLVRKRIADAEKLHRDTLELDRKALPSNHPRIAADLGNVAILLQRQDTKLQEAESLYREAIRIERAAPPTVQTGLAVHVENLAYLLSRINRNAEAEQLFRETLDNDLKTNAPPVTHATHLDLLAATLQRQDKLDEAESLLREAVDTDRKIHAPPATLAKHLSDLSWILQRRDKLGDAATLLHEALALRRGASPADNTATASIATASTATDLGLLLLKMNRLPEAETPLREALRIYSLAPKPDDLAIANVSSGLGRTLLGQNKYGEAEPLLRNAMTIRDRLLSPTNVATLRTATALADLLDRTGRRDLGDEIRQSHTTNPASTRPATQAVSEEK